jgi:hypothetical protein
MTNRLPVREARTTMSKIMSEGKTATVGDSYNKLRGFILGVPPHNHWNHDEKKKALRAAKANFTKAWIAEAQK